MAACTVVKRPDERPRWHLASSTDSRTSDEEAFADQSAVSIVLPGGRSSRMGQDKALLRIGDGPPLVALVVERLRSLVAEVIVVTSDGARLGELPARIVTDLYAD